MTFRLRVSRDALRYLRRLDAPSQERIAQRIDQLLDDPLAPRLGKPLRGQTDLRAARVGGWRLLYAVDRESQTVTVERIAQRGQVYRNL